MFHKFNFTLLICFSVVCSALTIVGCAGQAYNRAKQVNTIKSYDEFLTNYPDSKYSSDAKSQREKVFYEQSLTDNTIVSFNKYLSEYPHGKWKNSVQNKIEQLTWNETLKTNSIDSYKKFITNFPKSDNVQNALSNIEELYWSETIKQKTISSFQSYISEYPNGKYFKEANDNIEEISWNIALNKNSIEGYNLFLQQFPDSKYRQEATKRKEPLIWDIVLSKNTREAFSEYIEQYPKGVYYLEAHKKLEPHIWEETLSINSIEKYYCYINKYIIELKILDHIDIAYNNLEELLWDDIQSNATIEKLDNYLNIYPKGKYIVKVSTLKDDIVLKNQFESAIDLAVSQFSEDPIKDFIKIDQKGTYKNQSINIMKEINAFKNSLSINTIEGYEKLFNDYPDSKFIQKIQQQYDNLKLMRRIQNKIGQFVSWKETISYETDDCLDLFFVRKCMEIDFTFEFRGKILDFDPGENNFIIEIVDVDRIDPSMVSIKYMQYKNQITESMRYKSVGRRISKSYKSFL